MKQKKLYNVAVLGATGAVGQEMIKVLAERKFPIGELRLLASGRSAGKAVRYEGREVVIQEACDAAFEGMDIVLGAAENDIAKRFAPAIQCLWTIPALSALIRMCRSWCRKSTRKMLTRTKKGSSPTRIVLPSSR